jgi:hypothetical protein
MATIHIELSAELTSQAQNARLTGRTTRFNYQRAKCANRLAKEEMLPCSFVYFQSRHKDNLADVHTKLKHQYSVRQSE